MVSAATTQLCVAAQKQLQMIQTNEPGGVPIKLYSPKQAEGQIWPVGYSLPSAMLNHNYKLETLSNPE